MSEFSKNNLEGEANNVIEIWKQSPVFLASSSEFRLNSLKKIGFKNIRTIAAPESVEHSTLSDIINSPGGDIYNKHSCSAPADIAQAKIEYLLQHNNVPKDAFVCAVDTMPVMFRFNETETSSTPTHSGWYFEQQLPKPSSEEDAKKMIANIIDSIKNGYLRFKKEYIEKRSPEFTGDKEVDLMQRIGYPPKNLRINTGVAIRLPNTADIDTFTVELNLEPRAIYDIVDGKNPLTIEQLVEDVYTTMLEEGIDPKSVSGAIDYGNIKVRSILGVTELKLTDDDFSEDVYFGFPKKQFLNYLKYKAKSSIS
ncbi:MAG: Maf family protein [Candidatus Doudnabacteria bacterium]|nr:Maf family protein [Candidatus Doudnabacteria bacterium]